MRLLVIDFVVISPIEHPLNDLVVFTTRLCVLNRHLTKEVRVIDNIASIERIRLLEQPCIR